MRSVATFLVVFFLSTVARAQEPYAVEHLDSLVTVYEIFGGSHDGYLIYEIHGSCKVVAQVSETDYATSLENYGVWCSDDITGHQPNEQDDPLIMALEAIRMAGRTYPGSSVSAEKAQAIFLAFWYETTVLPCARKIIETSGLPLPGQQLTVTYFLYAYGVPVSQAFDASLNLVAFDTKTSYNQLGLTRVPDPARAVLREMSEAGPDYFDE